MTITFEFSSGYQNNQTKNRSQTYPILNQQELLNKDEKAFAAIISDLQKTLAIPEDAFNNVYLKLIHNYAEFVQSLPNLKHTNFNCNKGQLLLALLRAGITVETSDFYACPENIGYKEQPIKQEKRMAIWQFAVFSSALLLDLGPAITRFEISTCDLNYENPNNWDCFGGTMLKNSNEEKNLHYFYTLHDTPATFAMNKLTIIFAKLLIPNHVFNWLYSEKDIFFEWLGILSDETTGSGTLHKLTIVSLKKLLNEYMGSNLPNNILQCIPQHIEKKPEYHKYSFWKGVEHALRSKHQTDLTSQSDAGTDFIVWLQKGIADKSIKVNTKDANVHMSNEGVFLLSPEIFMDFCMVSVRHPNWLGVFKQLNKLGITKVINDTSVFKASFPFLDRPGTRHGIIIADPKNIFEASSIPNISPQLSTDPAKPITNSKIFPTSNLDTASLPFYTPGPFKQ